MTPRSLWESWALSPNSKVVCVPASFYCLGNKPISCTLIRCLYLCENLRVNEWLLDRPTWSILVSLLFLTTWPWYAGHRPNEKVYNQKNTSSAWSELRSLHSQIVPQSLSILVHHTCIQPSCPPKLWYNGRYLYTAKLSPKAWVYWYTIFIYSYTVPQTFNAFTFEARTSGNYD